jgi:hypothetical protein
MEATLLNDYTGGIRARIWNNARSTSIAHAAGDVVIGMDSVDYDPWGLATIGGAAGITVPVDGLYALNAAVLLQSANASIWTRFILGGITYPTTQVWGSLANNTHTFGTRVKFLTAGTLVQWAVNAPDANEILNVFPVNDGNRSYTFLEVTKLSLL